MPSVPVTTPSESGAVPAWDVARLFPKQGHWGEGDYLSLNRQTNRLVELSDGQVALLEMPTRSHQRIVLHLCDSIRAFAGPGKLGETVPAPYPVRLREEKFREPDLVFMLAEHADRLGEDFAEGADLVVEVLSDDRRRDLVTKRKEYAEAEISEYWIVDPREERVTILVLQDGQYATHSECTQKGTATSRLLPGLRVSVEDVFASSK